MKHGDRPTAEDLRRGPLFRPLGEAQLERISVNAMRCFLEDGEGLFQQGDAAERFYLLLAGCVKLYRVSPEGNEKVIELVTPGNTFAEALMFLSRPHYPVGAQAIGRVELISIDAPDFVRMLRGSVETCFSIMGDMSRRLHAMICEIDHLSLSNATFRVAGYLLRRTKEEGRTFDLGVPKQVIASRLTVKPETFSRIIKRLIEKGIIRVRASRIEVIDQDALARLAESQGVCAEPVPT